MAGSTFRRLLSALVLVAAVVPAASHAVDVSPVLKLGIDFGGDTLFKGTLTNGDTLSIKANEGFYLGGGASILTDSKDIEVELTLSYKFTSATASNGDVTWTRMPLEALVFYRLPQYRLGGGLTYHLSPALKGSGVVSFVDAKAKDAAGFVLQADYLIGEKFSVGLRYTSLEYKDKAGGDPAKSNGAGITFGMRF